MTNPDWLKKNALQVAEGVAVTHTVARRFPAQADQERLTLRLADLYRRGIYVDPPDMDEFAQGVAGVADLAIYQVDGETYYIQLAQTHLVVMTPEDPEGY
jgi:hypothetical protein